jgi:prepilin-type N-terminal cleavage/methylation domain-containing protein
MSTGTIRDQSGYSLVEVMVSIMILAIAIIPMVSMFDAGLNAATKSSNYDKAWAFANQQLERAKTLPYADVRDNFPVPSSTPGAGGVYNPSSALSVPASAGLPSGSTYTVAKQFVRVEQGVSSANMENSSTDSGMIRVTVTVNWQSNNSISVSGVVARRLL